MSEIRRRTAALLRDTASEFRGHELAPDLVLELEALAAGVEQPCVVAVVGRVKAGKSTFINALLGDEFATVGVEETTATINKFVYGTPDPARPVRCHWRDGRVTEVSAEFLAGLQGNDEETLRRADGIAFLETLLPIPLLKDVTLVDTPGTGAVVDEHQNRTAEFLRLRKQLRERHDQETRTIGESADAIVYLVGQVARVDAREFVEEFGAATEGRSRALNAVGVVAKVDLPDGLLERRHEVCAKIAVQLKEGLATVLPVSAGVWRALDALRRENDAGLERLRDALAPIPRSRLELLLSDEEIFTEMEFPDVPVSADVRRGLADGMPWRVFTSVARAVIDAASLPEAIGRLEEIAGFRPLVETLDAYFFRRAHLLRSFGSIARARAVLRVLKRGLIPDALRREREDAERLARFVAFLRGAGGDPATAAELEEHVTSTLGTRRRVEALERLHDTLDERLAGLFHELEEHNADFAALQHVEASPDAFTDAEREELRPLFGLYGLEVEKRLGRAPSAEELRARQMHWRRRETESRRGSPRQNVAARAGRRYGILLRDLGT